MLSAITTSSGLQPFDGLSTAVSQFDGWTVDNTTVDLVLQQSNHQITIANVAIVALWGRLIPVRF